VEFRAEVDGVLSPIEVAAVRKKLSLSQRKASELLGGGPRAFQKYEAGTQAVSAPMSNLLRLLAYAPSRLTEILAAKSGEKATRVAAARTCMGSSCIRQAAWAGLVWASDRPGWTKLREIRGLLDFGPPIGPFRCVIRRFSPVAAPNGENAGQADMMADETR
jgi:transcriptional regulator with XRE-family HTH domain